MRTSLAPHLDAYVLCSGWIADWEDLKDCSTRRVFISQPTIKKADKNLLYQEQEVISTEHHLNLFIRFDDLPNYDTSAFQLKNKINFTGVIEAYRRGDGTQDYGIYANQQSTLPYRVERLIQAVKDSLRPIEDYLFLRVKEKPERDINYLKDYAMKEVSSLACELRECGNMLPTFNKTYGELLGNLIALKESILLEVNEIDSYEKSKYYKRKNKRKKSNMDAIVSMKTDKEKEEIKRRIAF